MGREIDSVGEEERGDEDTMSTDARHGGGRVRGVLVTGGEVGS